MREALEDIKNSFRWRWCANSNIAQFLSEAGIVPVLPPPYVHFKNGATSEFLKPRFDLHCSLETSVIQHDHFWQNIYVFCIILDLIGHKVMKIHILLPIARNLMDITVREPFESFCWHS